MQTFLNYECSIPVREHESEHFGDIGTLSRVSNVFFLDRISALQDKLRHEVEARGYAEYEATDDEEEEGEEEQEEKHEDTPPASSTNAP